MAASYGVDTVIIPGLDEWQKFLKRFEPAMAAQLLRVNRELAEGVVAEARSRVYPAKTGRHGRYGLSVASASIKAKASQREARVAYGGFPTAMGFEFGGSAGLAPEPGNIKRQRTRATGAAGIAAGKRGAIRRTAQFGPHTGREGRFFWPAVREKARTAYRDWQEIYTRIFDEST